MSQMMWLLTLVFSVMMAVGLLWIGPLKHRTQSPT